MNRTLARTAIALALLLGLAACGSDADEATTPTTGAAAEGTDAFPVSIEHSLGTTEIPERPERVLSLGYQEHDNILALGVEPVAVRYWFGDKADVIFPWAEDAAGDAAPEVLEMAFGQLNFEKIASLRPDLILGIYSGITPEEYEKLSAIAPTVAQPDGYANFGVPWQDSLSIIGQALGESEKAEAMIDELDAKFAAVAEAHPHWAGKKVMVAAYRPGEYGTFSSEDPRTRFFRALGFTTEEAIDELAGETFFAALSAEQVGLLDVDLLVWHQMAYVQGGQATVEADSLVAGLRVMKEKRAIYLDEATDAAFSFSSVLSLDDALDRMVPLIEAAQPE